MRLFVGLGNPGAKYARNRHNAGFMALDRIAADHGFTPWRTRFQGEIAEGRLGGAKVLLIKPGSFMNRSGQPVGEAARYFDIAPEDITVFQDELDLAPGKVRVKRSGGHAGHNGLRSLHAHIGPDYRRVRIGIGHPGHKDRVSGYVLSDFAKAETALLDDVMRGISDGADALAAGDDGRFMNAVALRTAPPRASTGTAPKRASGDPARKDAAASAAQKTPPKPAAEPAVAPAAKPDPAPATDYRNALQRLADRFR
ncbi:MAG: aminoacyl-tRNA hydrolase [Rhodobacteraceae bacterium]|nr:aminoacyl-tRNA hydrolase [Paracoccaceae bacterium]